MMASDVCYSFSYCTFADVDRLTSKGMALLTYSARFTYVADPAKGMGDTSQILDALDYLNKYSAGIGAEYSPMFHDPAVVKRNKHLAEQLINQYRIGARIKRWWSKAEPELVTSEAINTIVHSKTAVWMRDFDSPEEWATRVIAGLTDIAGDSYPRICIFVWRKQWNTIRLSLYVSRDDDGSITIEGSLVSVEAHENHELRSLVDDCRANLKETGRFE